MKKMHKAKAKIKGIKPKKRPDPSFTQQFINSAIMGTPITMELVKGAKTHPAKEEDVPTINMIKDACWRVYLNQRIDENGKMYWISASILAAYQLGRNGLPNLPNKNSN